MAVCWPRQAAAANRKFVFKIKTKNGGIVGNIVIEATDGGGGGLRAGLETEDGGAFDGDGRGAFDACGGNSERNFDAGSQEVWPFLQTKSVALIVPDARNFFSCSSETGPFRSPRSV